MTPLRRASRSRPIRPARLVLFFLTLALLAAACGGGAEVTKGAGFDPDDPCAIGPIQNRELVDLPATALRPGAFDAEGLETETPIKRVVFLIKENRSFNHLFGMFPGVNGTTTGMMNGQKVQLRQCITQDLTKDLIHDYPMYLKTWNVGKMDGFACSDASAAASTSPIGRYKPNEPCVVDPYKKEHAYSVARPEDIPNYWYYAQNYTLSDNFYASAVGPSFPNHLMSIAASSAGTKDNPVESPLGLQRRAMRGLAKTWGCDSPSGSRVLRYMSPEGKSEVEKVAPCFNIKTEGDLLNEANIPWAYYAAEPDQSGYIWSDYSAIERYRRDPVMWQRHIFPVDQVLSDIRENRLPPVTWITPRFEYSDHPDDSICDGENWSTAVINEIQKSDMWENTVIFLTWDDWGGFYDPVDPRSVDAFGYGFRVPLIAISPYAKEGYLDSTEGEFSSVLRFIEDNWGLTQLTDRDREANNLYQLFDFEQEPRDPEVVPLREDCQRFKDNLDDDELPTAPLDPQDAIDAVQGGDGG